jgi:hypothetical protein
MTDTSGWSPAGVLSLIAIIAGIVLLVVYAVRRGMFARELDGTDEEAAAQAVQPPRRSGAGRPLGILGAILLGIGLALGIMVATGTWGGGGTVPPSGTSEQQECAANWEGCPKATPQQ